MEELFMLVQDRFSEANWIISLKALILVHILMHEGNGPTMYDYLINRPNALDMTRFRDRHGTKGVSEFEQSKNVRSYASYLSDKVLAYKAIRIDHVVQRQPAGSQIFVKHPTDIKFMLLEVSTVQKQLHSALKNRFDSDTLDNETTFSAFRYCLRDMLKLFQVMNFGVMKMLKVYFEMDEADMRRALDLYKRFVKLTDRTDEYLKIARQFETIFGFSIPNLSHAPLSLSKALEDFVNMPADERQAAISAMRRAPKSARSASPRTATTTTTTTTSPPAVKMGPNGRPKPDYGLRLKPELLALSDNSPPHSASEGRGGGGGGGSAQTAKPPKVTTAQRPFAGAGAGGSMSTLDNHAGAQQMDAAGGSRPEATGIDLIDFFSSIDDDATPGPAAATATAAVPGGGVVAGSIGMAGTGAQPGAGAATDFDAMFLALSNPFAALNTGGFGTSTALAAQQQQQQQQLQQQASQLQPADTQLVVASASPFSTLGGAGLATHNTSDAVALSMQQQQQQLDPFSQTAFSTAQTLQTPVHQQQQQQQQDLGGLGAVSTNNPFRQSMFPAQLGAASQQAMLATQLSQMSFQQTQTQQTQSQSTNPFTQRQTMYMAEQNAASLQFSAANHQQQQQRPQQQQQQQQPSNDQFAHFAAAFGSGSGAPIAQQPQYQLPQQQQHHQQTTTTAAGAHGMQSAINNGDFANFDFFK
ncbi:hypothetical protein H4R18_001062 [Coemansia javaensis]|uniref:ENTH domain-containing protein n=1 Tax=Coemansia javaensis TaxID=2761396 RepID=A0A9W8HLQ9_9FUNG|nr:hypothetical protein H4R18_001062 [Coemansia javaensis]